MSLLVLKWINGSGYMLKIKLKHKFPGEVLNTVNLSAGYLIQM